MKKIALMLLVATGCHSAPVQAIKNALIDCAKAEKESATAGSDVISVAIQVAQQFAKGVATNTFWSTTEDLILKYGEPLVACILHDLIPVGPSASDDPFDVAARKVIETKGWQYK